MVKVQVDELKVNQAKLMYFDKEAPYEMPWLVLMISLFFLEHLQQKHLFH